MILPLDIQRYILSFVEVTRTDWRTCRKHEAEMIARLISSPDKNWSFYDMLCYGNTSNIRLTVTEQGIMLMTGFQ